MKYIKIISALLSLLLVTAGAAGCGKANTSQKLYTPPETEYTAIQPNNKQVTVLPKQIGVNEDTSEQFIIHYKEIARNQNSILYADTEKGFFALQNINTEEIWYSTPNDSELDEKTGGTERNDVRSQIIVNYVLRSEENTASFYRTENSQTGCVKGGTLEISEIENGIRVVYSFKKSGITVPVNYFLTGDGFSAEIDVKNINEGKKSYLIGVNLLPMFGAGNWESEGSLFVPDGSGALIPFNGHNDMKTSYVLPVYGEEKAVLKNQKVLSNETVRMPVFGTIKQNNALMGIISHGDTSASVTALYGTDSRGYNSISSVMNYRTLDSKEMFKNQGGISRTLYRVSSAHASFDTFRTDYYLLEGDSADYVGMAEKYREYLTRSGKLKNSELQKPTFNIEMYGAADISTTFLGVKYNKTVRLTTFEEAEKIIETATDKGMKSLSVRFIGWSGAGLLNKKLDVSAKAMSALGGNGKFKDLLKFADENSVNIYPDIDIMSLRKGGGDYSLSSDVVRTMFNYKGEQYVYSRSVYNKLTYEDSVYLLNGDSVMRASNTFFTKYKNRFGGNISLTGLADNLYSDFGYKKSEYKDKAYYKNLTALKNASKQCKSVAVESANAYAFEFADRIYKTPVFSSGYDIYSKDVPFYQIVLHGLSALVTEPLIGSQDSETLFLKAVETGSELSFAGTYSETSELIGSRFEDKYSTYYLGWIDKANALYTEYMPLLEKIYNKKIVSHNEFKSGVFITEYENGIKTAVNYNETDADINGTLCKAKGFVILQGEGK